MMRIKNYIEVTLRVALVILLKHGLMYIFSCVGFINSIIPDILLSILVPPFTILLYNVLIMTKISMTWSAIKKLLSGGSIQFNNKWPLKRLSLLFFKSLVITITLNIIIPYCLTNYIEYLDKSAFICIVIFIYQNIENLLLNTVISIFVKSLEYILGYHYKITILNINSTSVAGSTNSPKNDSPEFSNNPVNKDSSSLSPEGLESTKDENEGESMENDENNNKESEEVNDPNNKGKERMPTNNEVWSTGITEASRAANLIEEAKGKVSILEDIDNECEKIIEKNNISLSQRGEKLSVISDNNLSGRNLSRALKDLKEYEETWHEIASEVNKDIFEIDNITECIPCKEDEDIKEGIVNPLKRKFDELEKRYDKNQASFLSKTDPDSDNESSHSPQDPGPSNKSSKS